MTTHYRQLLLHPTDPAVTLQATTLSARLLELALIGDVIHVNWPHRYFIGDRFLQYLSFMGCAPALEFKPADRSKPDWAGFTYVSITPGLSTPRCLIDRMMAKPRCPYCGKRHAYASQAEVRDTLVCPKCRQASALAQWDWYEFGGCGRQFLNIVNVYPKEAMPTDTLLQHLQEKTQCNWRYFYFYGDLPDG